MSRSKRLKTGTLTRPLWIFTPGLPLADHQRHEQWGPFLGRKVILPQRARLFKFFEGVYPQPLTLRERQRRQNLQYH